MTEAGLRAEIDDRNEKMGYKIRAAQTQKIPYMLVVGDKEVAVGSKFRFAIGFSGDEGAQSLESFLEKIEGFVKSRAVRP